MFTTPSNVSEGIVVDILPATPGTITVAVSGQLNNPQEPLTASLSGSGEGWTTDPQGLQMTVPGNYQLAFQMASGSLFTLVGIQVFFLDSNEPNSQNVAVFFPASSGNAVINLLHNVQSGNSVTYQMFIGVQNEFGTFWPDPTIVFEPDQG